uniref:Reverse transcriptase zinc-binding domain-containing protein n=1 Tax=Cajanus cajan TaxID=3821 RepID=A0A151S770_CAJCA|nr:hypothetical protein KK1_027648 [Cajanus cajan]
MSYFICISILIIPPIILQKFPFLLKDVSVASDLGFDQPVWHPTSCGILSLKAASIYVCSPDSTITWAKCLWSSSIPLSRSCLVQRLLQYRLPIVDQLRPISMVLVSICGLCELFDESLKHLFLRCKFAYSLWT